MQDWEKKRPSVIATVLMHQTALYEEYLLQNLKWLLINYWILLSNNPVFHCETKGEVDVA